MARPHPAKIQLLENGPILPFSVEDQQVEIADAVLRQQLWEGQRRQAGRHDHRFGDARKMRGDVRFVERSQLVVINRQARHRAARVLRQKVEIHRARFLGDGRVLEAKARIEPVIQLELLEEERNGLDK